ncbi:hypothetical protein FOPG_17221 [Fusarium oxysporum f. sp. conglutinans race 2 54008]|uniref:Ferulic acid decarboxylase 1 n=1 Tax=Fusarium oxysporum f. sp. conglutinans race 2 54008 TaxID=1089457 RepID=X0GTC9_FUSOX|nr:hypothetical protein FOPG_17221 [Fusarium oxysporum f. sp. conglutinans race 2 54008]KAG6989222.1 Ferulic acid decarboxylase 1 [Fusarium oxysporum f. sp. conglutinans]
MYRIQHRQLASFSHLPASTLRHHSGKVPARSNRGDPQLDFRAFVDTLREDGDLADIYQEVDPNLEVGAIVRRVSETNAKAPFFHNVKGARQGLWKMFGNAASLRNNKHFKYGRIARSLGLPPDSSWKAILERTQSAKKLEPLSPNVLPTGACKQNKIFGDDIDLTTFPVPLLHQGDAGKYLQTYGVHILQTPDGSWTNWSIFRGMVHDKRRLACLVIPGQHNSMVREQWLKQGKDEMPWALAFGAPPAASIAAALPLPAGVSEGEYVGMLAGKPLDMVKCELSDLLVPANSEIVLEGTFSFKDKALEGPFEDYIGLHVEGESSMQPLFTVNAITHRDNAILPVSVPGRITDESHTTASMASEELLELLKQHGLPIKDASAPFETMATWCALQVDNEALARMKTNPDELCTRIGELAFNSKAAMLTNRVLLIGDDVDIHNWDDVMWAYTTRCRPGQDEYVFENVNGLPLTPYMKYGRGNPHKGGKMVSNCLFPMEYEGKRNFRSVDFRSSYPLGLQKKVEAGWTQMGFDAV